MSDTTCRCETPEPVPHGFWTGTTHRIGQRCVSCGREVIAPTAEAAPEAAAEEQQPEQHPAEAAADAPEPRRRRGLAG